MGIGQVESKTQEQEREAPGPHGQRIQWDAQEQSTALRAEGRLAGILFIVCPLVSLPGALLIQPPALAFLSLVGVALLIGLVCLALPWERMSRAWLHVPAVIATVEVTALVAVSDRSFAFFFIFIAIYAAFVSRRPAELLAQLALIALGLLAPLVYESANTRATLQLALVAIPALAISAGMVMYLRERLEEDRRAYRRFAQEALSIAARIRGQEPEPVDPALLQPTFAALPLPQVPTSWRRATVATVGAAVAVASLPVALAAAGVSLPGFAKEPFERLGIELPNQNEAGSGEAVVADPPRTARPADQAVAAEGPADGDGGRNRRSDRRGDDSSGRPSSTGAPAPAPAELPASPVSPGIAPGGTLGGSSASPPSAPTEELRDTIDDGLRNTLKPVDRILGDLLNPR